MTQRSSTLFRKLFSSYIRTCKRYDSTFDSATNLQKRTINRLSEHTEDRIHIAKYSRVGFSLNNGVRIIGPTVFFPKTLFHWNVRGVHDIHEASLSLFTILEPKVDLLIIGVGDFGNQLNDSALKYLRLNKINFEVQATEQACATFNFMNSENRQIAAALLPPRKVEETLILHDDEDDYDDE